MSAHSDHLDRIHQAQECKRCRNFTWLASMKPARVRGYWHHPACPENSLLRERSRQAIAAVQDTSAALRASVASRGRK